VTISIFEFPASVDHMQAEADCYSKLFIFASSCLPVL